MLDFLAKFGVTIFFGLLSASLAITFYFKNKKIKQLSYEMISSTPILNKINNKIKVYFEDKEIKNNLYTVSVKIANTGNQPIKKEDFNNELYLKFFKTEGSFKKPFVFEANINSKVPDDLDLEIYIPKNEIDFDDILFASRDGRPITLEEAESIIEEMEKERKSSKNDEDYASVVVKPLLLNPKEQFTLSLLVTEFNEFKLSARIVGGKVIKAKEPIRSKFSFSIDNESVSIPLRHVFMFVFTLLSFIISLLLQFNIIK